MITPGKPELENLRQLLAMAMAEDLGVGDVTSELLPDGVQAHARFRARHGLVVCGCAFLEIVAGAYDPQIRTRVIADEGREAGAGESLAQWTGPAKGIMAAERVALNFLQRLCGVATMTRRYVAAVAGSGGCISVSGETQVIDRLGGAGFLACGPISQPGKAVPPNLPGNRNAPASGVEIYDTRKTTPGWRDLEKYAVRVGGGRNHRRGLYDAVLIKDNHLAVLAKALGGDPIEAVGSRLERLRQSARRPAFVELEVDNLEQFAKALTVPGIDIILLDNMPAELLREAVRMRNDAGLNGRVVLEASGGITLANLPEVARTGVERIAVGAITHSAAAVDIGLDIDLE